jgi:3-deoxy-manno-octulosonate cytidylyltransferase (CMP-KDO synthetase)
VKTAIIIPARYASSRLPGKPLLRETGKYLIQHVYERACLTQADPIIVATDDDRIARAVREFGGQVCLTRDDHPSGTDRVAEVARQLDADIIINLQGDEPLVEPAQLELLAHMLEDQPGTAEVATLAVPITSLDDWRNPNCVKVVCTPQGQALYFSRSPIPCVRDGEPELGNTPHTFLRHLGLYAYRREFLLRLTAAPPSRLEQLEKLEQLRVLELGARIQVGIVEHCAMGVDTPADYQRFVRAYQQHKAAQAA